MKHKLVHEPEEELMSSEDAWADAQMASALLRRNLAKAEPLVRLQVPLSVLLSALDSLNKDELVILHKRIEDRLAA